MKMFKFRKTVFKIERTGYGSYDISFIRGGQSHRLHTNASLAYDDLDSEVKRKREEARRELYRLTK